MGKVSGDGFSDLIVSAYRNDPAAGVNAGRSYVVFGSTSGAFSSTFVDQVGTAASESITCTCTREALVGKSGNDTIAGNGGGLILNLATVANQSAVNSNSSSRHSSLDAFDLTGSGDNSLSLTLADFLVHISRSPVFSYDTLAPSPITTSSSSSLGQGQVANISFSFTEDPGDSFNDEDIEVSGGSLFSFGGFGLSDPALFSPQPNFNGHGGVAARSGSYNHAAGNPGGGASYGISINTLPPPIPAPTFSIYSDCTTLRIGQRAIITLAISRDPGTAFTSQDVVVQGRFLSQLSGSRNI